jgi:hypothetical protein
LITKFSFGSSWTWIFRGTFDSRRTAFCELFDRESIKKSHSLTDCELIGETNPQIRIHTEIEGIWRLVPGEIVMARASNKRQDSAAQEAVNFLRTRENSET